MYVYARLRDWVALTLTLAAAACVSSTPMEHTSSCAIGETCRLVGTLKILRGVPASVGVIDTETGCVPLALPQEIYDRYSSWDNKNTLVVGTSFTQPDAKEVTWFALKDRQVATGGCDASPMVIYVTEIKKI